MRLTEFVRCLSAAVTLKAAGGGPSSPPTAVVCNDPSGVESCPPRIDPLRTRMYTPVPAHLLPRALPNPPASSSHLRPTAPAASLPTAPDCAARSARQRAHQTTDCGSDFAPAATLPPASQTADPVAHTRPAPLPAPASVTPQNSDLRSDPCAAPGCSQNIRLALPTALASGLLSAFRYICPFAHCSDSAAPEKLRT